jgi:hypothetical protein
VQRRYTSGPCQNQRGSSGTPTPARSPTAQETGSPLRLAAHLRASEHHRAIAITPAKRDHCRKPQCHFAPPLHDHEHSTLTPERDIWLRSLRLPRAAAAGAGVRRWSYFLGDSSVKKPWALKRAGLVLPTTQKALVVF